MDRGFYKWIGTTSFPTVEGGRINIVFLAEKQTDGQYRPCTRRNRSGVSVPGNLVSDEVYDKIMQKHIKDWSDVRPEYGSNGQLLDVALF